MEISIKDAEREIFRKYNHGAYRNGVAELFLHSQDVKYEPSRKVYMIDNKVIVDFVHPCIRNRKRFNNDESAFNELMNLIRIK